VLLVHAPTRAECTEILSHFFLSNPIHTPTFRSTADTIGAVRGSPIPLLPATLANNGPDFNPDPCNHSATNRIDNGDKYAVAPSPVTSVFERRITTVPDPSSAGSIPSINNDTSSSRRHIVSYATATNARSRMSLKLRGSIVAAGTYEALHVMRSDSQIASRFEQHELPVWTGSQELRWFIAGYLALLPLKKATAEIDKRFVGYLLKLSDGVTGRIIEVLRRAAFQALVDKSQKVGLSQLQHVGARMPSVIGRR
jgi:Bacterial TniB protein